MVQQGSQTKFMVQQGSQTKDAICDGVDWEPKNASSHSISLLGPNQACCTTVPGSLLHNRTWKSFVVGTASSRLHKYGCTSQPRHRGLAARRHCTLAPGTAEPLPARPAITPVTREREPQCCCSGADGRSSPSLDSSPARDDAAPYF